jgi:multiple sugar transport system permease protein
VFVGLENYATLLTDRYFWRAFVNTFVVVNVIVYVELALGLAIATLFAAGIPWRPAVLAIVLLPYAVSEVVAVIIWRFLMDPEIGIVTRPLTDLGLPYFDWAIDPVHGLALVCLISMWLHLPFTFLILYAARLTVPSELYEAARIDGASGWQAFRRVTFPMLIPAMLVALVFRYIFAFRLFSEVWLLTQGGPARLTEVLAVYLYRQSFTYNKFGIASAAGWVMVLLSGVIALLYLRLMYKRMFAEQAG